MRDTFLRIVLVCALAFSARIATAAEFEVPGGAEFNIKHQNFLQRRFDGVVRQKFDYSCGSAALATLLTYHYNTPVQEKNVLDAMYAVGDQEKIRTQGFSMLDMKKYLNSMGYKADGYRESLDKLTRVGIPAIVLINTKKYLHFVVVTGVSKNHVIFSDPAHGTRTMNRKDFEGMWNNILFVVTSDMNIARRNFNEKQRWKRYQSARFNTPLSPVELASFALNTAYTPGYY